MPNSRIPKLWFFVFSSLTCFAGAALKPGPAFPQESPADIVATQVRAQGHPCKNPQGAQRDQAASKPDQPVWLLQCQDASYRVRLVAGMPAQIERID